MVRGSSDAGRLLAALFAAGALLLAPASGTAHPLHTSLTEIVLDRRAGVARVTVRLFADDLARAVQRVAVGGPGGARPVSQASAFAYARSTLLVVGRDGRPVPLRCEGMRQTGDLVWISLSASAPDGLSGARIAARVLFEVYRDQVNIVQTVDGARRESLLFVAGDGSKRLP